MVTVLAASNPIYEFLKLLSATYMGVTIGYWVLAVCSLILGIVVLRWALNGITESKNDSTGYVFAGFFTAIGVLVVFLACNALWEFSFGRTQTMDRVLYKVQDYSKQAEDVADPLF